MFSYITALDTHGSKKPAEQTWKHYFLEVDPMAADIIPEVFDSRQLDYPETLLEVTNLLGLFQDQQRHVAELSANAHKRTTKRERAKDRKEVAAAKKLHKLQNKDTNNEKDKKLGFVV